MNDYFNEANKYSRNTIVKIKSFYENKMKDDSFKDVTIYVTGSFGRLEAREKSDVDLFFLGTKDNPKLQTYLRYYSFEMIKELGLPDFDKQGEFLKLHLSGNLENNIGAPSEDADNFFTARMLLLMESQCVFNEEKFIALKRRILNQYFRDDKEGRDFKPIFLVNDISRYWRTICLNYEYKRGKYLRTEDKSDKEKSELKLKNKKLKLNRIWLCYTTLLPLLGIKDVSEDKVFNLLNKGPHDRLKELCQDQKKDSFEEAVNNYYGFLEKVSSEKNSDSLKDPNSDIWKELEDNGQNFRSKVIEIIKCCIPEEEQGYLFI